MNLHSLVYSIVGNVDASSYPWPMSQSNKRRAPTALLEISGIALTEKDVYCAPYSTWWFNTHICNIFATWSCTWHSLPIKTLAVLIKCRVIRVSYMWLDRHNMQHAQLLRFYSMPYICAALARQTLVLSNRFIGAELTWQANRFSHPEPAAARRIN